MKDKRNELAKVYTVTNQLGESFVKQGSFQKGWTESKEQRQSTVNASTRSQQADRS
ncbi:hypothetical protein STEG23_025425, partial [Scotinomys teguina]